MRLLDTRHTLPEGTRLRVRVPQMRDRVSLGELLTRMGLEAGELDIRRALLFDPMHRTVICATAWTGTTDTMVGIVMGARDGDGPDLLIADEELTPGVGAALLALLRDSASRHRMA